MTATSPHPRLRTVPFRAPTARLALRSDLPAQGPAQGLTELHGAWWPASRDLTDELAALADVLDPLSGRITRVAVNPRNWPILPPRIFVNGHVVKVGWFTSELDPHQILVMSATAGRWNLLVVPPESDAPSAARLMAAATGPAAAGATASALVTTEWARHGEPEAGDRSDAAHPPYGAHGLVRVQQSRAGR
ncbi:DUF5994 family protein [Streptomyces sp. NPDC088387]|uniref:DUF5994 family protein n=1 Tax=Streptomyces sp. NPDC088387 TaxID=3365859 RepID=UPI0037FFF3B9